MEVVNVTENLEKRL